MTRYAPTMKIACPYCQDFYSRVINTRPSAATTRGGIDRRRECPNGHRYDTIETIRLPVPPLPSKENDVHDKL